MHQTEVFPEIKIARSVNRNPAAPHSCRAFLCLIILELQNTDGIAQYHKY